MILPYGPAYSTTSAVGYFEVEAQVLARWLVDAFNDGSQWRPGGFESLDDVIALLAPVKVSTRQVCVPLGSWTAMLTDGPLGTDVGLLPSSAAEVLGCRGMRAALSDDSELYPARILEVFGPDGEPPLMYRRTIAAAKDGARWVFETSGEPFDFEDLLAYTRRLKRERFTTEMLYDYLRALGVPIDDELDWRNALVVERM